MQGSESQFDYERLVADAMRDAMRNVLRNVLIEVAKTGLPGDHHFYISFHTTAPGVSLSKRLQEKYPEEMTIVLQHRFWDLFVHADRFEVKLQFNSIPEKLVVPFDAIRVFVDPSVRFGHQFDEPDAEPSDGNAATPGSRVPGRQGPRIAATGLTTGVARNNEKRRPAQGRRRTDKDGEQSNEAPVEPRRTATATEPARASAEEPAEQPPATVAAAAPTAPVESTDAKVVSLDKFRKK